MKIFFSRGSLIGDIIMCLPALNILHKKFKGCEIIFPIATKCQQASSLFSAHPLIKEIYITHAFEGIDDVDKKYINDQKFDLVYNPFPSHPWESDWYNYRDCCEETLLMADADLYHEYKNISDDDDDKYPQLHLAEENIPIKNSIVVWPFAGYGRASNRSPSAEWWKEFIDRFISEKGVTVFHCGAEIEPRLSEHENYTKLTETPFVYQIKHSLRCNLALGTDSGSMWCLAAYGLIPQINLLTNHSPRHEKNLLALAPKGKKCINIYESGGCHNIKVEKVLERAYENI